MSTYTPRAEMAYGKHVSVLVVCHVMNEIYEHIAAHRRAAVGSERQVKRSELTHTRYHDGPMSPCF